MNREHDGEGLRLDARCEDSPESTASVPQPTSESHADGLTTPTHISPLPWRVGSAFGREDRIGAWGAKHGSIGQSEMVAEVIDMRPRDGKANAEYIVRACNSYPALVSALKRLIDASMLPVECVHGQEPDYCDGCRYAMELASRDARIHARAALALAEATHGA